MTKERFVCQSIDKALAYCFNPAVSCEQFNKYLIKIESKLLSYVFHNKMTYLEFAQTDDILIRMKTKKLERISRLFPDWH